jgi:hypothetical protein
MNSWSGFFNGLFTIAVVTIIIIWGVTSLTNNDPLWFLSSFTEPAEEFTIYWEGKTISITADDPGYNDIMRTFADAIRKPIAYEGKVVFSQTNINNYKEKHKMLEVHFRAPVQVHTRYPYTKARTFLVPLDKTHAYTRRIFSFPGYQPFSLGPINARETNFENLYKAVENATMAH